MRRWTPTLAMLVVSLISYIDRNTLALLAPTLLAETRMTTEDYGFVISAFSLTYMLANPLWGLVLDRVGLRVGMLVAVTVWSIASAAHALAGGLVGFAIARAVLGFGEGATFPGGMRVVAQTLPPESRSRGVAVAYSGGSLGAVLTPLLMTPIATRFGVRAAFVFTGLIGLAWVAAWTTIGRGLGRPEHAPAASAPAPPPRLRDPRTWGFAASYAMGGVPLAFVLYEAPVYLHRAFDLDQADLGLLLWIPPLGWEVGYLVWGWLLDRGARRRVRALLGVLAALSLPLAAIPRVGALAATMAMFFGAMFVAAGFVIGSLAYATEAFGTRHAGFLAGLGAGSWSAVVMVVMPLFGRLFDRAAFGAAFALAAAFPVLGYAVFRALDRPPAAARAPA